MAGVPSSGLPISAILVMSPPQQLKDDAEPLPCSCYVAPEHGHLADPFCPVHGDMPELDAPTDELNEALSIAVLRLSAKNSFLEQQLKDLMFDYAELRQVLAGLHFAKDPKAMLPGHVEQTLTAAAAIVERILSSAKTVGLKGLQEAQHGRIPAAAGQVRCPMDDCVETQRHFRHICTHYAIIHVPAGTAYDGKDYPWLLCRTCEGAGGWHQRSLTSHPMMLSCPDCNGRGWTLSKAD